MKRRGGFVVLGLAWLVLVGTPCHAGMGFLPLTDWPEAAAGRRLGLSLLTRERLETLSFFLLGLLVCAGVIRAVWNGLRGDFPALPRLSYGKALGLVVLWGALFVLVMTMIAGARELLTPGAWVKDGWLYRLADEPAPSPRTLDTDRARRLAGIERLRIAIEAKTRQSERGVTFPSRADLPEEVFSVPGRVGERYLFVDGLDDDHYGSVQASEPKGDGLYRYVIMLGGEIRLMPEAWVADRLSQGSN